MQLMLDSCLQQNERQAEFFSIRQKIQHIWEEIETEPKGEFAQMVARGDITNFAFSLPNMDKLKAFHKEVSKCCFQIPINHILHSPG